MHQDSGELFEGWGESGQRKLHCGTGYKWIWKQCSVSVRWWSGKDEQCSKLTNNKVYLGFYGCFLLFQQIHANMLNVM